MTLWCDLVYTYRGIHWRTKWNLHNVSRVLLNYVTSAAIWYVRTNDLAAIYRTRDFYTHAVCNNWYGTGAPQECNPSQSNAPVRKKPWESASVCWSWQSERHVITYQSASLSQKFRWVYLGSRSAVSFMVWFTSSIMTWEPPNHNFDG